MKETREQREDGQGLKLLIKDDGYSGTYSIAGRQKATDGYFYLSGVHGVVKSEGLSVEPFLTLQPETIQDFFNQLWQLGFRPKDGTGNSGHIDALKYHLEDMRKLVFKTK